MTKKQRPENFPVEKTNPGHASRQLRHPDKSLGRLYTRIGLYQVEFFVKTRSDRGIENDGNCLHHLPGENCGSEYIGHGPEEQFGEIVLSPALDWDEIRNKLGMAPPQKMNDSVLYIDSHITRKTGNRPPSHPGQYQQTVIEKIDGRQECFCQGALSFKRPDHAFRNAGQ